MANKIDTNVTGSSIAEESALKTVSSPTWYEVEPDTIESKADYEYVARSPISSDRQDRKGTTTGLVSSYKYKSDMTQDNLQRRDQGMLWADAREKFSTQSLLSAAIVITAVDGVADEYEAASGLDGAIVNNLVFASGFGISGNNGIKHVVAAAAGAIGTTESLTAETSPPAAAKVEVAGFQFPSGDLDVVAGTNTCTLQTAATDCTTLGLNIGEWVYLGGDTTPTTLVSNGPGYCRVLSIDTNEIVLDSTEWTPANETGTGLTVQLFFGTFLRNEEAALIVRRSYQSMETLGEDDDGVQSMYTTGMISDEQTTEIPVKSKVAVENSYVGLGVEYRTGLVGVKSGDVVPAPGDDPFNTSTDLYMNKIFVHDASTTNPTALFGLMSDAKITIKNNVTVNEALSILGGFDATPGNIQCGGDGVAYFTTVSQAQAIANSSDVGWHIIFARDNGGIIYDQPLVGIKGGEIKREKDAAVTMPIEIMAAKNDNGYTMSKTFFPYLPAVAMPA